MQRHTAQQLKIISRMLMPAQRQTPTHRARQKQNHHDRRRDPERAVEIRIPFEHVQKVGSWKYGGAAALEDLVGVDIEELRVERDGPEVSLGLERGGRGCGAFVRGAPDVPVRGVGFGGVEVCGA